MGLSVTALRNKLTGGGARPSLFFTTVYFPTNVQQSLGISSSDMSFFMKAASVPESTLGEISKSFLGRDFKFPSIDRVFAPWSVTIINDEDYKIRHFFESWIEWVSPGAAIFESQSGFGPDSGPANVFGSMQVHQLKKDGGISTYTAPTTTDGGGGTQYLASYYFADAFPTSVSEMTLSWDDKDTIEEFTVTFAYQYWVKQPGGLATGTSPTVNPFPRDPQDTSIAAGNWSGVSETT